VSEWLTRRQREEAKGEGRKGKQPKHRRRGLLGPSLRKAIGEDGEGGRVSVDELLSEGETNDGVVRMG